MIKSSYILFLPLALALGIVAIPRSVDACSTLISWYADLTGASENPAVSTPASGRATYVFNFEQPQASVEVDTQNLRDVRSIEIRVARGADDVDGPAILSLYSANSHPFLGKFSKTVTDADVIKTIMPKIVANVVANGMAVVVVCTNAHPGGELAGRIIVHKSEVYNDDPNSPFHDPALHHEHGTAVPVPPSIPAPPSPLPASQPPAPASPVKNPGPPAFPG